MPESITWLAMLSSQERLLMIKTRVRRDSLFYLDRVLT
jgi:hypothetical protein